MEIIRGEVEDDPTSPRPIRRAKPGWWQNALVLNHESQLNTTHNALCCDLKAWVTSVAARERGTLVHSMFGVRGSTRTMGRRYLV